MPSPTDTARRAITDRLVHELGDRALAVEIVDRLDARVLAFFAEHPSSSDGDLLSFSANVEPAPDVLVVFAFGNRLDNAGALLPGPVNIELARLADDWVESTGLPVIAQWEVADEMRAPATRVGAVELGDGTIEYLSTAGVAAQAGAATGGNRAAVLAMADHVVRCCRTLERVGFSTGLPEDVDLPSVYDPKSGQPWTRDRSSYIAIDILARCMT